MGVFITKYEAPSVPCLACGDSKVTERENPKLNMALRFSSESCDARIEVAIHKNCLNKAIAEGLCR